MHDQIQKIIPDPSVEALSAEVYKLLKLKYPNTPNEFMQRVEQELRYIQDECLQDEFWLHYVIAKELLTAGISFYFFEGMEYSFVAYLLGCTEINPLLPHYYCEVCRQVEAISSVADGFDLPAKTCPFCGKTMHGDGHNLIFRWYLDMRSPKEVPLYCGFSTTKEGVEIIEKFLTKTAEIVPYSFKYHGAYEFEGWYLCGEEQLEGCMHHVIPHPYRSGETLRTVECEFDEHLLSIQAFPFSKEGPCLRLEMLCKRCGVAQSDIPMDDPAVYQWIWEAHQADEPNNKGCLPSTWIYSSDLEKMEYEHTLWRKNFSGSLRFSDEVDFQGICSSKIGAVAKQNGVRRKFCDVDTIYQYFLHFGISEEAAFGLAKELRHGNWYGKDARTCHCQRVVLPKWFVNAAKGVKYLQCRAFSVLHGMRSLRLAWFALYFPEEFRKVMQERNLDILKEKLLEKFQEKAEESDDDDIYILDEDGRDATIGNRSERVARARSFIPATQQDFRQVFRAKMQEAKQDYQQDYVKQCECCGYPVLFCGDICDECGWEQQESAAWTGANPVDLKTYRKLYIQARGINRIVR